jgi:hypothetical protein
MSNPVSDMIEVFVSQFFAVVGLVYVLVAVVKALGRDLKAR